jgi:hypothetical protein
MVTLLRCGEHVKPYQPAFVQALNLWEAEDSLIGE